MKSREEIEKSNQLYEEKRQLEIRQLEIEEMFGDSANVPIVKELQAEQAAIQQKLHPALIPKEREYKCIACGITTDPEMCGQWNCCLDIRNDTGQDVYAVEVSQDPQTCCICGEILENQQTIACSGCWDTAVQQGLI